MVISPNDGLFDNNFNVFKDILINSNGLVQLSRDKYTPQQLQKIKDFKIKHSYILFGPPPRIMTWLQMSNEQNVAKLVRLINVSIASLKKSRIRVANIVLEDDMTELDANDAIEITKDKLAASKITPKIAEEFRNGELKTVIKLKKQW